MTPLSPFPGDRTHHGLVIDAFAGPGGWDTGLRMAGYRGYVLGIEHDMAACRTAVAAGHWRVQADVATFPLAHLAGRVEGMIASPPCQAWSAAGDRKGELDRPEVYRRIAAHAAGRAPEQVRWHDERSALTAEPMRYAVALRPRWIALEQVPAVLPLWQYTAELLRTQGYRTWTGVLSAERFGVAQTRERAILTASLDQAVTAPQPTHQAYRRDGAYGTADLFGTSAPPPVSIREALGWRGDGAVVSNYGTGGDPRDRGEREFDEPAATISTAGRNKVVGQYERQANGGRRDADAPSLTITASLDNGNLRWRMWPAGLTGSYGYSRAIDAPSPTIKGGGSGAQYVSDGETTRKVTVEEAAALQSFPAGYPWFGTQEQRYRQVGDAVPPLLAAAVLRPLIAHRAAAAA